MPYPYEDMPGVTGISGVYFFPSGTQVLSGVNGDLTTDFQDFSGVSGYTLITLNQNTIFSGVEDFSYPLFSGTDVGAFASGIYNDLGLISGQGIVSIPYISGWLSNHIGDLNININSNFSYASGFLLPPLNYQQVAVYEEIFNDYYYNLSASNLLGASQYDWTRLTEADSTVVKVSRNELAKTYRMLRKDSQEKLRYLVGQYKINLAVPSQVAGDDTIPGLFWGSYGFGMGFGYGFDSYYPYYGFYYARNYGF
jgi:hypothetical protein